MKIVDFCESNKQMSQVCVSSLQRPANLKVELPVSREAFDKSR